MVLLLVPGRPRRIWALAVIGLGLVAISAPLLDVYQNIPEGQQADPELVKFAARRILLAAAGGRRGLGAGAGRCSRA